MKDLVFFGMPGAGKGTQVELLLKHIPDTYVHLSTGDIFRSLMAQKNAIGDYVRDRFHQGLLIDDQVTISLFNAYFFGVLDDSKYMLLDGYPRTITQLDALLETAAQHKREVVAVYFELSEAAAIQRMQDRGREGEDLETIKQRLQEYYTKTAPIIEHFRSHATLITIDAHPEREIIHQHVIQAVT